eukprot:5457722-Pyramimonas_sp.AAC.1
MAHHGAGLDTGRVPPGVRPPEGAPYSFRFGHYAGVAGPGRGDGPSEPGCHHALRLVPGGCGGGGQCQELRSALRHRQQGA